MKRTLSLILSLLMCLNTGMQSAFALEEEEQNEPEVEETVNTEETVSENEEDAVVVSEKETDAASAETEELDSPEKEQDTVGEPDVAASEVTEETVDVETTVPEEEALVSSEEEIPEDTEGQKEETPVLEITEVLEWEETVSATSETDNDDLFAGYVNQVFGIEGNDTVPADPGKISLKAAKAKSRGSRLSGLDLTMYNFLQDRITEVAAGTRTSTVFEIPLEDLNAAGPFTAADLGVEAVVVNSQITEEAKTAWKKKIEFDLNAVIDALRYDHPYEMFWFDGPQGTKQGTLDPDGYDISGSTINGEWALTCSGTMTISMSVAKEYSESGEAGTYQLGNVFTAVHAAADNAQNVVNANTGMTDYEKVTYYLQTICNLTSYNHDAADNDDTPYGNPWQLIWVFDNDPSTTVVCEGYSKAFKYLCDLSSFNSSSVEAHLVTGTMAGGTGEGGHMWNVVRMNDGKNYVVDVTNCDEGTIGAPDSLFLKAPDSFSDNGYAYNLSNTITYTYDSDTLAQYSTDELTISAADYDPNYVPVYTVSYDDEQERFAVEAADAAFADAGNQSFSLLFVSAQNQESYSLNMAGNIILDSDGRHVYFTYHDLGRAERGKYIPEGDYILSLYAGSEEYRLTGNGADGSIHVNQINAKAPNVEASFTTEGENAGITISCADEDTAACTAYFETIAERQAYTEEGNYPRLDQGGSLGSVNAGITIGTDPLYMFPDVGGNYPAAIQLVNDHLFISYETMSLIGVSSGTYDVFINAPCCYEQNHLADKLTVTMDYPAASVKEMGFDYVTGGEYDGYPESFHITAGDPELLKAISQVKFTNISTSVEGGGPVYYGRDFDETAIRDNGDGTYTLFIPLKGLYNLNYLGAGEMKVSLTAPGYVVTSENSNVSLDVNPFHPMPAVTVQVIGDGFSVKTVNPDDNGVLEQIANMPADCPLTTPANAVLNGTTTNGNAIHISKDKYEYTYDSEGQRLIIKAKYSAVKDEWNIQDDNASYNFSFVAPFYGNSGSMGYNQYLAPMQIYEAASGDTIFTKEELDALDQTAVEKVQNINVNIKTTGDLADQVTLSGVAAAAVASNIDGQADATDLNYHGEEEKNVTVSIDVHEADITGEVTRAITSYISGNGLSQANGYYYEIDVTKNSEVSETSYQVTDLPYEAAVTLDLPSNELKEGEKFILLREHTDGTSHTVDEIPFEIDSETNKAIARTDQFSTFGFAIKPAAADFKYEYNQSWYGLDPETYTIKKYTGSAKEVVIPSEIDGIRVTSVSMSAFSGTAVEKITVSEGITYILEMAFSNADKLKEIILPDSLEFIGNYAFYSCDNLSGVYIPAGVTQMGRALSENSASFTAITIDENNTKYRSVDGVAYLKDMSALKEYPSGKQDVSFEIPEGVQNIWMQAFSGNTYIENLTIPSTVTFMEEFAIANLSNLKTVTIGEGIVSISRGCFQGCDNLTDIYYLGTKDGWDNKAIDENALANISGVTMHYSGCEHADADNDLFCDICHERIGYRVTLTSVLQGSTDTIANVQGGGIYRILENGMTAKAIVSAPEKPGYSFVGWYEGTRESYRDEISTSLSYTFTPEKDIDLVAVYKTTETKFGINVTGNRFAVNGSEKTVSFADSYTPGTSVALEYLGDGEFLYWENETGKIISRNSSYTFTLVSPVNLTAVVSAETGTETKTYVEFVTLHNQVVSAGTYSVGDSITIPAGPSRLGYSFKEWSMNADAIAAAIAEGLASVTVTPVYDENISETSLYVISKFGDRVLDSKTYTGTEGRYITVTADEYKGYVFAYWQTREGAVLSTEKEYAILSTGDTTIEAIYVLNGETVESKPVIALTGAKAFKEGEVPKMSYITTRSVPEGYTVVEHGIVRSSTVSTSEGLVLGGEGVMISRSTDTSRNGVYTLTIRVAGHESEPMYARAYMVLEKDGETMVLYSENMYEYSYNNLLAGN